MRRKKTLRFISLIISFIMLLNTGILTVVAESANIKKTKCVEFANYTSPKWHCNRYETTGEHNYSHYFFTSSMAYHEIGGELAYCIEPNTQSKDGITYNSYSEKNAASNSYWELELDSKQRDYIKKILCFGYPEEDYGYGKQAQYAATQTLIWEVIAKLRYSDINSCKDSGLYNNIKDVLGSNYTNSYKKILDSISNSISDGKIPSFSGKTSSAAKEVTLKLNLDTNCYEAVVTDSNKVLSYFDFSKTGVKFKKTGNTLSISIPKASAASFKGSVITGTGSRKVMSTCNPFIWEKKDYQTVLTKASAQNEKAYIKLNWEESGNINLVKKVSDKSISVSGWKFYFKNNTTGKTIEKTTDSNGNIAIKDIEAGTTYTITEEERAGYKKQAAKTLKIEAGKTSLVTFTNVPLKGNLEVQKSVNYGKLDGFVFELYGTSEIGQKVDVKASTDTKGLVTFKDIYTGTYTLKEILTGDAYVSVKTKKVTISADNNTGNDKTTKIDFDNNHKMWKAEVTKVDADTKNNTPKPGASLDGAEYTLYKNGKAVKTYVIKNGSFLTDLYECTEDDNVYTLKETKAPLGYTKNDSVYKLKTGYSSYKDAENKILLVVEDTVLKGKVLLHKYAVDSDINERIPEKGAEFIIWPEDTTFDKAKDDEKDTIVVDENGEGLSKDLPFGKYIIKQTKGFNGYSLYEENIEVKIEEDGQIVKKDTKGKELVIFNEKIKVPGSITIEKKGADNSSLKGSKFLLEYKSDEGWKPVLKRTATSEIEKGFCTSAEIKDGCLVTDSNGKVCFEGLYTGDLVYRLTEIKAPENHEILKEVVFEGKLPLVYPEKEIKDIKKADLILNGSAYFYNVEFTVKNGGSYMLPMTGGKGFWFVPAAIILIAMGIFIIFFDKNVNEKK